ncbi:hypothetical protein [Rariglobus hedericola]|uniref:Uncharacterized protein n=1 Tax=Rariglobus hedericola TaxID=2597822 RepID=A0A556QP43_9BACT|nr:hypothetical protein [Rariglobus hedericola]TSJ78414.1 hypothetical protein FPL22_03705 [Rariglobus hedericola]
MKLPALFSLLLVALPLHAFTVVKDVSLPPVEKMVLFDKKTPPAEITFFNKGKYPFERGPDGSLVVRISGNDTVDTGFGWAANPKLAPSFSVTEHAAVLITFRLEGANRSTFGNGQVNSRRADNLWNAFILYDENQKEVARAGLADGAPGGKTPSETISLRIPMIVFTYWGVNPRPPIHGFGFQWNGTPNATNNTRDYTLIIDRVVVVD